MMQERSMDLFGQYRQAEGEEREGIENELVRLHQGIAIKLARQYKNVDAAEGEAFLGLLMAIRKFDPTAGIKFSSFAWPVVTNRLKLAYRKRENDNEKINFMTASIDTPIRDGEDLRLSDVLEDETFRDFDEVMGLRETVEVAKLAIQMQPERRRQVLQMQMSGMTYQQIGDELGISTSAVGKHMDRIRAVIRDAVKKHENGQVDKKELKDPKPGKDAVRVERAKTAKPWSKKEDEHIRWLLLNGKTTKEIIQQFPHRGESAVIGRASRVRKQMREDGEL